jgi:hypothetical protein
MIYLQILAGIVGYLMLGVSTMCFYAYVDETKVENPDDKVLVIFGIFLWPILFIITLTFLLYKSLGGFLPKIMTALFDLVDWFGTRKLQKRM